MVAGTHNVLQPLDRHTFLDDITIVCYNDLQFQLVILCHVFVSNFKAAFFPKLKIYVYNKHVYALLGSFITYHIWDSSYQ